MMNNSDKPFEVEKTFGLGVLLKLTKKSINGVEIYSDGEKLTANMNITQLSTAVDSTLKAHNIKLKIK